ncbi:MAG: acetate--CoA ligase family protein, partial [Desulfobacterales bacterium]|nr:acetate--CoA ligase family protein [Desulfobacterales bacterium]
PVNPKYDAIEGLPCYPAMDALPKSVDVALLLVPAARVEAALQACVRSGARSAVIISSGFAELGAEGAAAQARIRDVARRAGMPVLGPNCLGLINLIDGVPLSFSSALEEARLAPGGLALVSQSGAIATYILGVAQESGIGFAFWVTTGNEAVIDSAAVACSLLGDTRVSGVLLYLEEARDPRGLIRAGQLAAACGKPLICLKVGRSGSGKRAALSHTGALAGSDAEYAAAFAKAGIVRAENIEELLDLGVVLSSSRQPRGNRLAIMSISGGGGILCADRAEALGFEVPELGPATQERLAAVIPAFGTLKNPVDMTAELLATPGLLRQCLEIILADGDTDAILLFLGMNRKSGARLAQDIVDVMTDPRRSEAKPLVVSWMAAPADGVGIFREAGLPLLFDGVRAVNCLAKLRDRPIPAAVAERAAAADGSPEAATLDRLRERVREYLQAALPPEIAAPGTLQRLTLSESVSKGLLECIGLPLPRGAVVHTPEAARALADRLGYPVVVKVDSADLPHKTEAGAVRVGIRGPDELAQAYESILERTRKFNPAAAIRGVLVEEMVADGLETIAGVRWSDKFGPLVLFGMGGGWVEVLKDVCVRLAPLTEGEALEMIASLTTARLFKGFRGRARRDTDAVVRVLVTLSRLAAALGA